MKDIAREEIAAPRIANRSAFHAELEALRDREKAHTHESDAIAAARRRLPLGRIMCERSKEVCPR